MLIGRLVASRQERRVSLIYGVGTPVVPGGAPSVDAGRELVARLACTACHSIDGTNAGLPGPGLKGLYGSEVHFNEGKPRQADEAYLIESILEPGKAIVAGYPLGMGTYADVLSDRDVRSIVLFIKSLNPDPNAAAAKP